MLPQNAVCADETNGFENAIDYRLINPCTDPAGRSVELRRRHKPLSCAALGDAL
jgi:hypothetical protein